MIKKAKIKLKCENGKHDWERYIRGNAMVDNLNGTYSMWEIPGRVCKTCERNENNLGEGFQLEKENITINDLKYRED